LYNIYCIFMYIYKELETNNIRSSWANTWAYGTLCVSQTARKCLLHQIQDSKSLLYLQRIFDR
jgi:hypothetical protein